MAVEGGSVLEGDLDSLRSGEVRNLVGKLSLAGTVFVEVRLMWMKLLMMQVRCREIGRGFW